MVKERDRKRVEQARERPGIVERTMFAKVELWVVLALALLSCLLLIGFGASVLDGERETGRFGVISEAALTVAEIPDTARQMLKGQSPLVIYNSDRYEAKPTGWSFPSGPIENPKGYLLLSRYDGTEKHNKVQLISMPDMRVVYDWPLNPDDFLSGVTRVSRYSDHSNWDRAHFREIHPWVASNGDLIIKDHFSPLFRVDACGNTVWMIDKQVFHHSTQADAEGNLWIPSLSEHHSLKRVKRSYWEDDIAQVSPAGKILRSRSVTQILMRHGYANWLFTNGMYNDDPTHLNDIQPTLTDGPYWKKGDLFLSLRNISTIMLYRPSTDEIIWMKRGPWLSQHDVDVLDDHRISIYDNAAQDRGTGGFVEGASQIMIYDFATGKVTTPLKQVMEYNKIRTLAGGLFTQLPDGSMMLEDVSDARFLIVRPDGRVAAEYVNRARDGDIYHLGWSRYIDKAKGDVILDNLRKVRCDA